MLGRDCKGLTVALYHLPGQVGIGMYTAWRLQYLPSILPETKLLLGYKPTDWTVLDREEHAGGAGVAFPGHPQLLSHAAQAAVAHGSHGYVQAIHYMLRQ
jgi:hypothetical protein